MTNRFALMNLHAPAAQRQPPARHMRTPRSVSLTLFSVRRPRPPILRSARDKRSVKLSNIVSRPVETVGRRSDTVAAIFATAYHEAKSLLLCNGWSCGHVTLYCFFTGQLSTQPCPFCLLLPLVAHFLQPALIVPDCCKNSGWRRAAILSAVIALVHAVALESRIPARRRQCVASRAC